MGESKGIAMTTAKGLVNDMESLLEGFHDHHSEFQIDYAIVGRGGDGHIWGMYQQARRELRVRYDELQRLGLEEEKLELDIQDARRRASKFSILPGARYRKRRAAIELRELKLQLRNIRSRVQAIHRESLRFVTHARTLGDEIAKLPPAVRDDLEMAHWEHRFCMEARTSAARDPHHRVSQEVVAMLPFLPDRVRDGVHDTIKNIDNEVRAFLAEPQTFVRQSQLPPRRSTPLAVKAVN